MGWILAALFVLAGEGSWAEEPSEKAGRYHQLLLKRPNNQTIYERFYDAWMDEGTREGLVEFLTKQAEVGGAAELWILASSHQQAGRDEEALKALDLAVEKDGENAALLFSRAQVNGRLLEFEKAIEDLDQVAKNDEEKGIEALKLKGTFLARVGKPEEGVTVWKKLLDAHPGDEELAEDLIELEIGEGLYDEALATAGALAEGTKDAYQKALRRLRVGEIQKLHGKSKEAVKTYATVLNATGQGSWMEREVLAQIDDLFKRDDDFEGLRKFYTDTAQEQPQRTQLRKALAQLSAEAGKVDEAEKMLRELMKLAPGDLALREELVDLLARFDRAEAAAEELEKLIAGDQKNAGWWERLADLRAKTGDKDGLKLALQKIEGLAEQTEEARLRVARLYERFLLKEDAERILRAAAEGNSLEAREALASFLMDSGEEEAALAQWREMAEGANLDGLMRVARTLQARGKVKEAYRLMVERRKDFGRDPVSLAMFCQVAQMADQPGEALAEARRLVALATKPTEIHDAVQTASRLILRAKKEEEILGDLGEKATVNDLCLGAELQELIGDSRAADALLKRAEEGGGGLLAQTQRVRLLERRGDFTQAAAMMKVIVESKGGRRPVYRKRLVELLRRGGQMEEALVEIERWKQATPGDKLAWLAQADVLGASGAHEKAVTILRRAQARFGREEEIRVKLARAYLEVGETRAAQLVFEKLYEDAEQAGEKVRWAARLAELAEEAGTVDELIATFERRKRGNPKAVTPLLALAEIYRTLDRYDERREALLEATRRRPKDLDLRFNLAKVEEQAGDLERAVESLEAARKHDKTGATQRHLARLFIRYGEVEKALAMLRESDGENTDPREVESMADVMIQEGEWKLAGDYLAPFLATHADDLRLRYLAALILEETNQSEQAVNQFLEVLLKSVQPHGPIAGVAPLVVEGDREHWNKIGTASLPPRAVALNQVFFYLRHAFAHQTPISSRNMMGSNIALPGDGEEARALAVCHLMKILRGREGAEQSALMERIEGAGVADADLLLQVTNTTREGFVEVLHEKLEESPQDVALLLLTMGLSTNEFSELDKKWLVTARDRFRKEMPYLAFIANLDLVRLGDEEQMKAAWNEIAVLLDALEADHSSAGLAMLTGLLGEGGTAEGIAEEEREALFETLMSQFRKSEAARPRWTTMESGLLSYATKKERDDLVIEILNGVCGRPPPRPPVGTPIRTRRPYFSGSLYANIQSRRNGFLQLAIASQFTAPSLQQRALSWSQQQPGQVYIQPKKQPLIPYPPTSFTTVPQGLVSMLRLGPAYDDPRFAQFVKENSVDRSQFDREKLFASRDKIEDPSLRLLIIANGGDKELLRAKMEEVVEKEEATFDELLFAAGYFGSQGVGDRVTVFNLLVKARKLGASAPQGAVLDYYLLMLGAELAAKDQLPNELHETAKRAGLRLRRDSKMASLVLQSQRTTHVLGQSHRTRGYVTPRQPPRDSIASALAKLGVEAVKRPVVKRPRVASSRNRTSTNAAGEQIGKLLQQGNRAAAVRRAARDIGRHLRLAGIRRGSSKTISQMVKVVKGLGLTDDVLAQLDPGEAGGEIRQERFAATCQLFGLPDRTKEIYGRILEKNPKNMKVKAQLFAMMTGEERGEVLRDLEMGEEGLQVLQQLYGTKLSTNGTEFVKVMELLRTFTLVLEVTKPSGKTNRDFSFVNYRAAAIGRKYQFANNVKVRRLTAPASPEGNKDSKETLAYHLAFYDLCVAMLRHPQTAVQGFMLLHYTAEGRGDHQHNLESEAQLALMALSKFEIDPITTQLTTHRWSYQQSPGSWRSTSAVNSITPPPAEYLLWLAGEEDRPDLLSDDMIGILGEKAPVMVKRMKGYRRVLFLKGEERLKAFNELGESLTDISPLHPAYDLTNGIRILMAAVGDDLEFVTKIGETMLEAGMDDYAQFTRSVMLSSVLPVYAEKLYLTQGRSAYQEFLEKISVRILGPKEDWDLVNKAYQMAVPKIRAQAQAHSAVMGKFVMRSKIAIPTSVYLTRHGLDRIGVSNLQFYLQQAIRSHKVEGEEEVAKFFTEHGFLAETAKFDPLGFAGDPNIFQAASLATVLEALCASVRSTSSGENYQKLGLKWMEAEGELRFAKRLIGAALQKVPTDQGELIAAELVANRKAIEAMPQGQQVSLARFITRWFGKDLKKGGFPTEMEGWRDRVGEGNPALAREQIEEWLKNGFANPATYNVRQQMQAVVLQHLEEEPEVVARLVSRYVQDLYAATRAGQSPGNYSSGTPVDAFFRELAYRWRNGEFSTRALTLFAAELLQSPAREMLNFEAEMTYSLSRSVMKTIAAVDKRPEIIELQKNKDVNVRLPAYWKKVAEELMRGVPASAEGILSVGVLRHLVNQSSVREEDLPGMLKAVSELKKSHPQLGDALALWIHLRGPFMDEREDQEKGRKILAEFLRNEKIPNELRFDFIDLYTNSSRESWMLEKEVSAALAGVLTTHVNGKRNVVSRKVSRMLQRVSDQGSSVSPEAAKALLLKLQKSEEVSVPWGSRGMLEYGRELAALAIKAGDKELLNTILGGRKSPFRGNVTVLRQLFVTGNVEAVQLLLPAKGEFFTLDTVTLDRRTEEALSNNLPAVEDEAVRYRLECVLSNYRDEVGEGAPKEAREERLKRLAALYPSKAPKGESARLELLSMFAEVAGEAPKELREEIIAEAGKVILAHNLVLQNTSFTGTDAVSRKVHQIRSRLVPFAVKFELSTGKAELALKQFAALGIAMENDPTNVEPANLYGSLLPKAMEGVVSRMLEPNSPKKALLPFVQSLVVQGLDKRHRSSAVGQNIMTIGISVYAMAGAGAEFDALVEGLPKAKREFYDEVRKTYGLRNIFSFWAAQPNWDAEGKNAVRRALLRAILNDQVTCDREIVHMTDLSKLMDSKAFGMQDVLAEIDALPADHPRRAEFLLEKAGIIGWRDKEKDREERARVAYEVAIGLAKTQKNDTILNQAYFYHAQYALQILSDPAQAGEIGKNVKPDLLVERDRKMYGEQSPQWIPAPSE